MYERFKVTKVSDSSGKITLDVDRSRDLLIQNVYVTVQASASNKLRNITLERPDGSVLGLETVQHLTSQATGVSFDEPFILPKIDPLLVVNTATVLVSKKITFDCYYEAVEVEN